MFAFKVTINGADQIVAGIEDWQLLTATVTANRARRVNDIDEFELRLGGLVKPTVEGKHEHIRWKEHELNVGDQITIELVEVNEADDVTKRYRSDKARQENPFTEAEIREMKRKQYLSLKAEFENEGDA